jgi:hypothetical protein
MVYALVLLVTLAWDWSRTYSADTQVTLAIVSSHCYCRPFGPDVIALMLCKGLAGTSGGE